MIRRNLTSYPYIDQVISLIAEGIIEIFHENLIGIYLFGSLSYGDFHETSSDIDLVAILKNPASKVAIEKLQSLHAHVEKVHPQWAQRIECSYTPHRMLSRITPPEGARPYYGEGVFYAEAPYGNEWLINLYLLQKHGITVYGPSFNDLIPLVKMSDVQQACRDDLFTEWEPKLRDPEWLDDPHYQSYLVLNLCRILNTIMNAAALSKTLSAEWVKQEYPEWIELIRSAEEWQYGKEMGQKERSLAFLTFVTAEVKKRNSSV